METVAFLISCAKEMRAGKKRPVLFQMSGIILFLGEEKASNGSSILEFSLVEVTDYTFSNKSVDT